MNLAIKREGIQKQPAEDDAGLLNQAQHGDGEAFGVLYGRYARQVNRYLYAHLNNHMDAEDLTEEVFLRVWQRMAEFHQQGVPFAAFLLRVAHNVLVDHYRSFEYSAWEPLAEERSQPDVRLDPGDQVTENMENQELRRILGQLRAEHRRVLAVRFLKGLSTQETAQAMGKTEGATRVLQHRALEALRKLLEKQ